jgi:probable rRNA maturation factor
MALTLDWNNEQDGHEIGEALIAKLEQLLAIAGREEGVENGDVAVSFVNDEQIHELNRTYRNIDRPTDVLSFPMLESGDGEMNINYDDLEDVSEDGADPEEAEAEEPLGDIVISVQRAIAQSEEYGHSVDREIGFLFVHGFLHLLGYDHESDEEERTMTEKQERILQEAGLTR